MFQPIMLLINIAFFVSLAANQEYKRKKECEYKKDERWSLVQDKADKIISKYYEWLIAIVAIGTVALVFVDLEVYLSLDRVFSILFIMLTSRYIVELFALRFYDSKI